MTDTEQLQAISDRIGKLCRQLDWKKDWANGGVYIHLEVSEFIEALRGKGKTSAIEEAADVLITLTAVLDHYGIRVEEVITAAKSNLDKLENAIPKQLVTISPHVNEGSDIHLYGAYYDVRKLLENVKTSSIDSVAQLLESKGYQRIEKLSSAIKDKCDITTTVQCDKYTTQYLGFKDHIFEKKNERVRNNGLIRNYSND